RLNRLGISSKIVGFEPKLSLHKAPQKASSSSSQISSQKALSTKGIVFIAKHIPQHRLYQRYSIS
ncbi:unnamed protein product, partial [Ilex paraguariensis]